MKTITVKTLCVMIGLAFAGVTYGDPSTSSQSRTGSLDPVNAALRANYGQVVSAAQVRSGVARQGRIVRAAVDVPREPTQTERVMIRRGPAVKLMNP